MSEIKDYLLGDYSDTVKYVEKMQKGALAAFPPLIIACALTGGFHGKETNINLPEAVEEQAAQARDAYNAGASMVHIHRRIPENPSIVSNKTVEYLEVNSKIREVCPDIIINNTAMGGRRLSVVNGKAQISERRVASIPARPEVASIDLFVSYSVITMKERKPPLTGRPEALSIEGGYLMKYEDAIESLKLCDQYDVKPEFELNQLNDIKLFNRIIQNYQGKKPYWVQLLVNGQGTFPIADMILNCSRLLPRDAMMSVIGLGIPQIPIITTAMILGHHVRVGMEDNVYYGKGEMLASNAQMVEKVVRIADELGRPIATPAQARQMMGLPPEPRQYEYYEGIQVEEAMSSSLEY